MDKLCLLIKSLSNPGEKDNGTNLTTNLWNNPGFDGRSEDFHVVLVSSRRGGITKVYDGWFWNCHSKLLSHPKRRTRTKKWTVSPAIEAINKNSCDFTPSHHWRNLFNYRHSSRTRPQHCTTTALKQHKPCHRTVLVALGLYKIFDTVNHTTLFEDVERTTSRPILKRNLPLAINWKMGPRSLSS